MKPAPVLHHHHILTQLLLECKNHEVQTANYDFSESSKRRKRSDYHTSHIIHFTKPLIKQNTSNQYFLLAMLENLILLLIFFSCVSCVSRCCRARGRSSPYEQNSAQQAVRRGTQAATSPPDDDDGTNGDNTSQIRLHERRLKVLTSIVHKVS